MVPEDQPPKTDHIPIDTIIETETSITSVKQRRDFRMAKWKKIREILEEKIREEIDATPIMNSADLNCRVERLNKTINDTVEEVIPMSKPMPYTKRWWSKDLVALRQQMRSRARAAYRNRSKLEHPTHAQYKDARNKYANAISDAKKINGKSF